MASVVEILIKASGGDAAEVFRKIGDSAKDAARSMQDAGKASKDAASGVKSVGDAAPAVRQTTTETKQLATSMQEASRTSQVLGTALGAAFTAIGAGLALASKAALDQQQQLRQLQTAWGDNFQQIEQFSRQLSSQTIFPVDQIREGERLFAGLARNYGLTVEQIKQLSQVTADLATASGLSFADAAHRVEAAIRGEAESAEALGLTMNQQAIDRTNLTLTMSNQEAAQFRLNALMQQSAFAQGAAAREAATGTGTMTRYGNAVRQAAADLGQFVGPLPAMLSGLSSVGIGLFGLSTGFQTVIPAIRNATAAVKEWRIAQAAMSLATGPVGLAIAAVGIAATVGIAIWQRHAAAAKQAEEQYKALQSAVEATNKTIGDTKNAGNFALAAQMETARTQVDNAVNGMKDDLDRYQKDLATYGPKAAQELASSWLGPGLAEALKGQDFEANAQAWTFAVRDYIAKVQGELSAASPKIQASLNHLLELFSNPNIDTKKLQTAIDSIIGQFNQTHNVDQLAAGFQVLVTAADNGAFAIDTVGNAADKAASDFAELQKTLQPIADDIQIVADRLRAANDAMGASALQTAFATYQNLRNELQLTHAEATQYDSDMKSIFDQMETGTLNVADTQARLSELRYELATGQITTTQYLAAVHEMATANETAAKASEALGKALVGVVTGMAETAAAAALASSAVKGMADVLAATKTIADDAFQTHQLDSYRNLLADIGAESAYQDAQQLKRARDIVTALALEATVEENQLKRRTEMTARVKELGDALDALQQAQEQLIKSGLQLAGMDSFTGMASLAGIGGDTIKVAAGANRVNDAMGNMYRVIVQNTQAIAQQQDQLNKWALDLINVRGEYGKIDDLLHDGKITLDQYNAAQMAQEKIATSNAAAQEAMLVIQAKQAPVLADAAAAQAEYLQAVSKMPEAQQAAALAAMDNNTQLQAQQALALAASAANGELGASGEQMATQLIQGAVAANPALAALLEQMGLISVGADGTITVNFDSAKDANSAMAELTKSIDALTLALGGVPPLHLDADTAAANAAIDEVTGKIRGVDGTHATTTVDGDANPALTAIAGAWAALTGIDGQDAGTTVSGDNSGALAAISGAAGALAGVDGASATLVVDGDSSGALGAIAAAQAYNGAIVATAYVQIAALQPASIGSMLAGFAHGGTVWADQPNTITSPLQMPRIPQAANGRVVMVGEAGPELAILPGGSYVVPHGASQSMRRSNPGLGGGLSVNVTVQGNVYGIDDLTWAVSQKVLPAIADAYADQRRGQGV